MPRTGSVWDESVCRVPKAASRRTIASMLLAAMSFRMTRRPVSGVCLVGGMPGPEPVSVAGAPVAGDDPATRGIATAAADAADAVRNARRLVPVGVSRSVGLIPMDPILARRSSDVHL